MQSKKFWLKVDFFLTTWQRVPSKETRVQALITPSTRGLV